MSATVDIVHGPAAAREFLTEFLSLNVNAIRANWPGGCGGKCPLKSSARPAISKRTNTPPSQRS